LDAGREPAPGRQLHHTPPDVVELSAFPPVLSARAATIPGTISLGGTMRHTTALLLTACLALAGCSSAEEPEKKTAAGATATTATPTPTPSLNQTEIKRLCSVAVSEAAPEWDDWNYDFGKWQDDPRTPEVCQGLADEEFPPRGNREFMAALLEGLELADDPRADQ
jgi:hypothetical protein